MCLGRVRAAIGDYGESWGPWVVRAGWRRCSWWGWCSWWPNSWSQGATIASSTASAPTPYATALPSPSSSHYPNTKSMAISSKMHLWSYLQYLRRPRPSVQLLLTSYCSRCSRQCWAEKLKNALGHWVVWLTIDVQRRVPYSEAISEANLVYFYLEICACGIFIPELLSINGVSVPLLNEVMTSLPHYTSFLALKVMAIWRKSEILRRLHQWWYLLSTLDLAHWISTKNSITSWNLLADNPWTLG